MTHRGCAHLTATLTPAAAARAFDLALANTLVAQRTPTRIAHNMTIGQRVDETWALEHADNHRPILLSADGALIDGHHRSYRAQREGVTVLAHQLNEHDTRTISRP